MNSGRTVVLFGGTGFIGTHVAMYWLRENLAEKVILVDLNPPRNEPWTAPLHREFANGTSGLSSLGRSAANPR